MKNLFVVFKYGSFILSGILLISCVCPQEENSSERLDEDFNMITPFVNIEDMGPINEAFSVDSNCPWGFEHRGIDFFSNKNLASFQAVCPGEIKTVHLWQNDGNGNWQVNLELQYNSNFSVTYAFEPMTSDPAHGQAQLDNILVNEGQEVTQGEIIGNLFQGTSGTHVHFGVKHKNNDICPEFYFTPAARDSIMQLIHQQWPGANMCYE
ncbi:MAG: M23 family metallopeptidase [bacterium]